MTPEIAKILREPFPAELVGKLPRVWCKACRDAQFKVCQQHERRRCQECGNNITNAHLHLDYVGHAEITDRLLHADAGWTWEPVAFADDGLPLLDRHGGLWIRLTVADVTRLGYGHADGKSGPDAVKEAIGDALRNAAMRFGVALDLWGAKFKDGTEEQENAPEVDAEQARRNIRANARRAIGRAANDEALDAIGRRIQEYEESQQIHAEDAVDLRARVEERRAELKAEKTEEQP